MATTKLPKANDAPFATPAKQAKTLKKKPAAAKDADLIREEVRRIPVDLSDKELLEKGNELADILQKIECEEANTELIKADIKARMSALEAQRANVVLLITSKKELRDVRCSIVVDRKNKGMVKIVRNDNGQVVGTREMTGDERQRSLPLDTKGKKDAKDQKDGKADNATGGDDQQNPAAA